MDSICSFIFCSLAFVQHNQLRPLECKPTCGGARARVLCFVLTAKDPLTRPIFPASWRVIVSHGRPAYGPCSTRHANDVKRHEGEEGWKTEEGGTVRDLEKYGRFVNFRGVGGRGRGVGLSLIHI